MKTLNSDIERFSSTILSLVPYSHHPKLDELIRKIEKHARESERFLIKMEIKRLSQPCSRVIDLREMFPDSEPVHYNNLCHFLDKQSKDVFFESIDRNGGMYTIYLYESIVNKAKQVHSKELKKRKEKEKSVSITDRLNNNISLIPLVNTAEAVTENCAVGSCVELFSKDPLNVKDKTPFSITDSAIDLVCVTKKVIMVDFDAAELHEVSRTIFISLSGHTGGLVFSQDIVLAVTVQSFKTFKRGGKEKVRYYLTLDRAKSKDAQMATFKQYLIAYEKAKRAYFESLVPALIGNVKAKAYEQFITSCNSSVTLLVARFREYYRPSVTIKTKANQAFMDRIGINNHTAIERVLLTSKIQNAISTNASFREIGVWVRGKTSYWLTLTEYVNAIETGGLNIRSTEDLMFIDIEGKAISPMQTYRHEQVVSQDIAREFNVLEHNLSSDVSALLRGSGYQIILSERNDIKQIFTDAFEKDADKDLFDESTLIPLPSTKYRSPIVVIDAQLDDIRREDRFVHEFPITITSVGEKVVGISGKTVNISSKGLCVQLSDLTSVEEGRDVKISIDMRGVGGPVIEQQSYLVLGKNSNNCVRLVVNQNPKKHKAARLLKRFIMRDGVKLLPSGANSSRDFQLSKSLRTIFARNLDACPFYIHKSKTNWSVTGLSMMEGSSFSIPLLPTKSLKESFADILNNAAFRASCAKLMSLSERDCGNKEAYLVVMPITIADETSYYICSVDDVLNNKKHREFFSDQAMKRSDISILSINIAKVKHVTDKFYRDELDLLHTISQSASHDIRDEIAGVSFVGGMRDVTSAFMPILIDKAL